MANPLDTQVGGVHYKNMAIQPFEFITGNGIGFAEGNVIRYVSRWRSKGGIQDLEKAKHYLELLIAHEQAALDKQAKTTSGLIQTTGVATTWLPTHSMPGFGGHVTADDWKDK